MADYSYPSNISQIKYASYLEIAKYEYNKGFASAQNAANIGTQPRIANFSKGTSIISGAAAGFFTQTGNSASILTSGLSTAQRQALGISAGNNGGGARSSRPRNDQFADSTVKVSETDPTKIEEALKTGSIRVKTGVDGQERTITSYAEFQQLIGGAKTDSKTTKLEIVLPNEMSYSYGAEWNNTFKLGTLALLAGGNLGQGLGQLAAAAGVGAGLAAFGNLAQQGAGNAQTGAQQAGIAALQGGAQGLNAFGINSPLGVSGQGLTNLVGLAGLAPNENSIQFFQRMQNREFNFTFEMFAPESTTADMIEKIINEFFKQGMHPADQVGLLAFPDTYEITPKFVPGSGAAQDHKLLPKSKLCALTNLKVNASPANFFQTTYEGYIPIVTCEVTFKELTALSRADVEKGL